VGALWRVAAGIGVLALAAVAVRLGSGAPPEVEIDRRRLAAGLTIMLLAIVSVVGTMFFVITYLQGILDFSPLVAGAAFMPFGVVAALISPFAMRLLERFGFGRMLGAAVLLEVAGLLIISRLTPSSSYALVGIALALVGGAMSVFPAVSLHLALSSAPSSRSGLVSGAHTVAIQLGQLLSIAIIGSLVASRVSGIYRSLLLDDGLDPNVPKEITTDLALGRSAAPPGASASDGMLYEIAGEKAFTTAVGNAALLVLGAVGIVAVVAVVILRPKPAPPVPVSATGAGAVEGDQ
jgi:DHA2 family multidrug resistance protein-like MFS transporter